ncbi:MAG: hypothetical protein LBM66_07705 [Bifidobacteriaceae bacterium]|jgi:hypothetical protein|nr:hypothetical protein [Bifidobacteriaceae bacterium]
MKRRLPLCAALAGALVATVGITVAAMPAQANPAGSQGSTAAVHFCTLTVTPVGDAGLATGTDVSSYLAGKSFKLKFKLDTWSHKSYCTGKVTVYNGKKKLKSVKVKKRSSTVYKMTGKLSVGKHKIKMVYRPSHKGSQGTTNKITLYKSKLSAFGNLAPNYVVYDDNYTPLTVPVSYTGQVTDAKVFQYWDAYNKEAAWTYDDSFAFATASTKKGTYTGTAQYWLRDTSNHDTVGQTYQMLLGFSPDGNPEAIAGFRTTTMTVLPSQFDVAADGNLTNGKIHPGTYQLNLGPGGTCTYEVWGPKDSDGYAADRLPYQQYRSTQTVTILPTDSQFSFSGCGSGPIRVG